MEHILEMRNIGKTFPGVRALDNVTFSVAKGDIHCLVGENGAGKSTLMKILSGIYKYGDYEGEIVFDGQTAKFASIKDSEDMGIGIIHQELALIPELSIYENMFLGHEVKNGKLIDWNKTIQQSQSFLDMVNLHVKPELKVKDLGVGQQQLVEIAKALSKNLKLLILDEPTAALNDEESENLLILLKKLKKQGVTSIMISHKLKEILEVADHVTVLRDGKSVNDLIGKDIQIPSIIKSMVGRSIEDVFPKRTFKPEESIVFEVKNLSSYSKERRRQVVKDVSFDLHKGEVLGIAGLMGAGRTELALSMFGNPLNYELTGEFYMDGQKIDVKRPKDAINAGLAYVSEDRKGNGLILIQDIKENISLAGLKHLSNALKINKNKEIVIANQYKNDINIKTPSVDQKVRNLSGGNQQKVSLSKWLFTQPKVLILDEPTRGIDVGAKFEIYNLINDLVKQGLSIIMISSELPEVMGMSDRIMVINEGKLAAIVDAKNTSAESIMHHATY